MVLLVGAISSIVSLIFIYSLLSKNILFDWRKYKMTHFLVLIFTFLFFAGFFLKTTTTTFIFSLFPLLFLTYILPHITWKIPKKRYSWMIVFLLLFFLLFPMDLSVGFDAQRNLLEHMISIFWFYVGLWIVLTYIFSYYTLNPKTLFTVGGILGVTVEQSFLGLKLLFSDPFSFTIFAPNIFLVYGLYMLFPYIVFIKLSSDGNTLTRPKISIYLLAWMLFMIPLVIWLCINLFLTSVWILVDVQNI